MGRRGAGRRLNDQERMEILDVMAREPKVKNVDLAKQYGVSEGAIRKLKQIKDTIRDRYILGNEHNRDKRKRGGFRRNALFEQELYEWICRMRETQAYQLIPLTQTAVRQQAILLAKNYEAMATFKASPGWFARFCSRHRLDPPMAPMRDLEAITAEAEAAASATLLASSAMASGALGVDVKLAGAEGEAAALVLGFPPGGVDAMQALAQLPVVQPVEEKVGGAVDLNCPEEAIMEEPAALKPDSVAVVAETPVTEPVVMVAAAAAAESATPSKAAEEEPAKRAAPSSAPVKKAALVYSEEEIFSLGL
ncbi:hypothetical protein PybrP1_005318 [[Pythium] brassicae (nom. inval.)]|nr:hypothetical protein PybrP1_005318 [[Pythium] brassicae (nom. inval.)]